MPDAIRALLLEQVHPVAVEALRAEGHIVDTEARALDEDELLNRLGDYHVLGVRSKTHVSKAVLEANPQLLAVGAFCIGTNQIDLDTAAHRGIAVFNAPFSNTRSVVELALAEIISMTRRLTEKNDLMHNGIWDKSADGAHEVRGRTLGIVGYGNIGTQLSVLAESLGMRVLFYDLADRLALGNARRCFSLEELLASADIVSVHVDGRAGNRGFFGEDRFALMRDGAVFLNLSRGFVIDAAALRRHIESGHLAGAALDVFPVEPRGRGDEFVSELRGLPNVILTPHIGGSTEEAQQDIGRFVAGKFLDYLGDGTTTLAANVPPVQCPPRNVNLRLLHLHRNVPGVLAKVNGLLAEHGVNVEAQSLATRGDLGYVVTDSTAGVTQSIVDEIRTWPETIRLRVLF